MRVLHAIHAAGDHPQELVSRRVPLQDGPFRPGIDHLCVCRYSLLEFETVELSVVVGSRNSIIG